MLSVRITDGRTVLWQYDTGVQIQLLACPHATECHFVVPGGVIRRDVVDGLCDVPDGALTQAGILTIYAFERRPESGVTRHEIRLIVNARPKPAGYVDPPDEVENLEELARRVAELLEPEEDGKPGKDGGYYTPIITQPDANTMRIEHTASSEDMPGIEPVDVALPQGPRGDTGPAGKDGSPGRDGQDGNPGKDGTSVTVRSVSESDEDGGGNVITFSDGTTLTVKNGRKGSAGEKGDKGDPGEQGPRGEQGIQGEIGPQGIQGVKGDTGPQGQQGEQGPAGADGAKGDKGDKGDPGVQGPKGDTGATGATGPAGTPGKTPVKGVDYWTAADQESIVQQVISALPDASEVSY